MKPLKRRYKALTGLVGKRRSGDGEGKPSFDHPEGEKL
jgi:hypothetical protein